MNFGLSLQTISKISGILFLYPEIESAIIFGSRAKGNFKDGSDIDLTFTGQRISLELLSKVNVKLDDLSLPYTIDLSIFSFIKNPDLIDHIKHVGKVFFKKESE